MLLAQKVEVRATPEQAEYLNKACGARRHCYNQLLAHFKQDGVNCVFANEVITKPYFNRITFGQVWTRLGRTINARDSRISPNLFGDGVDNENKLIHQNVKVFISGMVKNRKLARAVSDAGFGMLRQAIEYKSALRGGTVIVANRWFPSSKTCCVCGQLHDMPLSKRTMACGCGNIMDRDLNAAKNLEKYSLDTFQPDYKRTQELNKAASVALVLTV